MGKSSKRKGAHYEREIVKIHTEHNIVARKVPLSGAMAEYPGDVIIDTPDHGTLTGEVKSRKNANGFNKNQKALFKYERDHQKMFGRNKSPWS